MAAAEAASPPDSFPDPHRHLVDVHALPWSTEMAGEAYIDEVQASWLPDCTDLAACSGWAACTVKVVADSAVVDRIRYARLVDGRAERV